MFITVNGFRIFILGHMTMSLLNNMGCFGASDWIDLVHPNTLPHIVPYAKRKHYKSGDSLHESSHIIFLGLSFSSITAQ